MCLSITRISSSLLEQQTNLFASFTELILLWDRTGIKLTIIVMAIKVLACGFVEGNSQRDKGYHDLKKNELRMWGENRYIKCLFCMDYDDYEHLSVFGCNAGDLPACYGNACYMRQHKDSKYFLYTSGCLNITERDYSQIREKTLNAKPARGRIGIETQLCEVTLTINTCLCTNRDSCNNISSVEPFSEFTQFIFKDTNFDEVAHFRHFLPNDPILKDPQAAVSRRHGKNSEQYILLSRSSAPPTKLFLKGSKRKFYWYIGLFLAILCHSFLYSLNKSL